MAKSKLNPELVLMAAEEGANKLAEAERTIGGLRAENATLMDVMKVTHEHLEKMQDIDIFSIRSRVDDLLRYLERFGGGA